MRRALFSVTSILVGVGLAVGCGGATPPPASVPSAAAPSAAPIIPRAAELPLAMPDVELWNARGAIVGGTLVPVDGVVEGLAWPALQAAVKRAPGSKSTLTIGVARDVPVSTVLRAVWTLRDADIHVQTPDATGAKRVLDLRPKQADSPSPAGDHACHLAVFVSPTGDLRIAAPGGARAIPAPDAAGSLARALAEERTRCPLRYVAFGADSADAPWGSVFDVAAAVDREKSAGDARYVLGEPVHLSAR